MLKSELNSNVLLYDPNIPLNLNIIFPTSCFALSIILLPLLILLLYPSLEGSSHIMGVCGGEGELGAEPPSQIFNLYTIHNIRMVFIKLLPNFSFFSPHYGSFNNRIKIFHILHAQWS